MDGTGKHAEADSGGKRHGFPHWHLGAINRFARRLEIPGKDSAGTLLSDLVLLPLRRGI